MDIKDKFTGKIISSLNANVLSSADLSGADLFMCIGNMREIKTTTF